MPPIRHIVYECLPGAYAGGVQKMVFELASAQRRSGADVEIWTPDAVRAGSTEIFAGLPIRYFYPDPLFGLARSHRLSQELATLPSDAILHAHNTFNPLNVQVGRAAAARGLRVFYHPHGALDPALFADWRPKSLKKRLYIRFFTRPKLNRATGVFALTVLEQAQLRSLGVTSPIHVVPNGIRPVACGSREAGLALRARHGLGPTDKVVLFIGRITAKKRIEDIIRALGDSAAHLFIAGNPEAEPEYAASLRTAIAEAGCAARVHWVGFMDEAAKAVAYAASDVFVHASESEGMALAILEAISAGLPVVATEGCYMAEAAQAGALVECRPGAPALAFALRPLLTEPDRAREQGLRGQAYVGRVHDWAAIARRTLEIYAGQGGRA
ncbi:MAG: glycosyltransferase [Verrucomicrobia bacterium]|nr:glycosyltransferase [Verrucomicrobiota bacterium]